MPVSARGEPVVPSGCFWSQHVFVLFSPDTLRRGLQVSLLDRLTGEGFPPVAGRLLRVDPEMIDDLYADVIAGSWQTWRYRLVDHLFGTGPALALICRSQAGHDRPHALLRERKGDQHPHRAMPGTIRHDFAAVNSVLGLLHTSDSPAESAREASVFGLSETEVRGPREVRYLCALSAGTPVERRGFDEVLAGVRARVLLAVWDALPAKVRDQVSGSFPERSAFVKPDAGAALERMLEGHLPEEVTAVLRCDFTPEWHGQMRMHRAVRALRSIGVELDTWEGLVLDTSLYFPPARGRPVRLAA